VRAATRTRSNPLRYRLQKAYPSTPDDEHPSIRTAYEMRPSLPGVLRPASPQVT
jgi:hypothetical protein